jgi:hypothetical protein
MTISALQVGRKRKKGKKGKEGKDMTRVSSSRD